MNVYLLYPDREWNSKGEYYDAKSILQDLNLKTLFSNAGKEVIKNKGKITHINKEDTYISETMRRVMMVPLQTREELVYRHDIIKDCFAREEFIVELYDCTSGMLSKWDRLGRKTHASATATNPAALLINQVHVLKLFVDTLSQIRELFNIYSSRMYSKGFLSLQERLEKEYPVTLEEELLKILADISFYTDTFESEEVNRPSVKKPKITFTFSLENGLKVSNLELEDLTSTINKYHNPNGVINKLQDYVNSFIPNSFSVQNIETLCEQAGLFEYQVVDYVMKCCGPFMDSFCHFFDDLHFQSAFYRGIVNLRQHFLRFDLNYCFPSVSNAGSYHFQDLKDPVMCMEQRIEAVGNDLSLDDRQLLIITGANQGGKSTFLRSMGIAQVMFQSGMFVAALSYEGAFYRNLFTHFTRREDSAMNSGRLDEELKRMSDIIDHVIPESFVLLNESFASTTEKEGSCIAYDIIKALTEHKVYVITVTHLLSFAKQVYEENSNGEYEHVAFLSAERLEDGTRTYKMRSDSPQLTSFGLDLYNEIIG